MASLNLLHVEQWTPLSVFGLNDPFFAVDTEIVIFTWITLAIIATLILIARIMIARNNKTARYLTILCVNTFIDMTTQALGRFSFTHLSFIASLFIFIMVANCMPLVPYMEEPTANLNTTLALAVIAFLYIQFHAMKHHGIKEYLKEYFQPFFLMLPLHIVGKLSNIVSMSFRLFGNIFGGATISKIYLGLIKSSLLYEVLGIISGINFIFPLFFGLLEGLLQAFVFTMLTLSYLSIALNSESETHEAHS